MKLVVVKNDKHHIDRDTGLGEANTGGTGNGRGYSSGRCTGFGNDTTTYNAKERGTGNGEGDKQLKDYEIDQSKK